MLANVQLSILNKILHHNEGSISLLKAHIGKSFELNLVGISIAAVISESGTFLALEPHIECDVSIIIPPTTANYLVHHDKLQIFKQITFAGDAEFGRELLEILSNLHLYGIYSELSPWAGVILTKFRQIFTLIHNQLHLMSRNSADSISEYLLYESTDVVTRYEITNFCNDVDDLTNRFDRLNQRINLLLATRL